MTDRTSWLQTYSPDGNDGAIDLFDPRPGQYTIEAIARSLAMTCRFRGMTRDFYSVAQHCVLGSRTFERPSLALAFLLHELDEVVTGDILPGIKAQLLVCDTGGYPDDTEFFEWLTGKHVRAALESLGLADLDLHSGQVKKCDLRMLATEKRDLLGKSPREWHLEASPFEETIKAWPWYQAELAEARKMYADERDYEESLVLEHKAELAKAWKALEAVLLFHSGATWDEAARARWLELTGKDEATTKVLCDTVRALQPPGGKAK